MKFYTSDTHFSHARIIELCNRPFDNYEHMNEALIDNWNAVVAPSDIVFHLGDVALGPVDTWDGVLSRLNGYKVLIVGNHDRMFQANETKTLRWNDEYGKWFDEIHNNITDHVLADGTKVSLSHFPYEADHMDNARYMSARLPDEGQTLIHGHTHLNQIHSRSERGTLQIHVGQDAYAWTPVSQDQIIAAIKGAP